MTRIKRTARIRRILAEMHALGCTRADIADTLGMQPSALTYHAQAIGLEFQRGKRPGVPNKRTPALRARIVQMQADGIGPKQIGHEVCLGVEAVRWHLRQATA